MNITTRVIDHSKDVLKSVIAMTRNRVLVGVPSAKAAREADDAHGADREINNAALAYIHDNGAPEAGIPARPFMRPGIENAKPAIIKGFKEAGQAALSGQHDRVVKMLNRIGLTAQSAIQEKITDGPFVPLKPETIERKGSDKPLIDTGQLRKSITYVVETPERT